jgi:hypothetical protein
MATRFRINVTQRDIDEALRRNSARCVVATAIARSIPTAHHIEVDTQLIRFTDGANRYGYLTPYGVQGYVIAFDAGDPISPFSFEVRDPLRIRRKGLISEGKRKITPPKEAKATVTAPKVATVKSEARAVASPRLFRRNRRAYGHRQLRANQEKVD